MSARSGWAWGTTTHGEWLTIAGSRHSRPTLTDTPDAAVPYPTNIVSDPLPPVLALVEEQGDYFRIIETAGEAK